MDLPGKDLFVRASYSSRIFRGARYPSGFCRQYGMAAVTGACTGSVQSSASGSSASTSCLRSRIAGSFPRTSKITRIRSRQENSSGGTVTPTLR